MIHYVIYNILESAVFYWALLKKWFGLVDDDKKCTEMRQFLFMLNSEQKEILFSEAVEKEKRKQELEEGRYKYKKGFFRIVKKALILKIINV